MSNTAKQVLFWVFLVLLAVSVLTPDSYNPLVPRGRWVFAAIFLVILGLKAFGGG